jgi:hypothetical protein
MTARTTVSDRLVSLDRSSSIRVRVEQDLEGRFVVTLRMERWRPGPAVDGRTAGALIEVPPNRLHEVAVALNNVARELGIRP